MDGYQNLADAIVKQACEDYRDSIIKEKKLWDKLKQLAEEREELERFFVGEDFLMYSDLDGFALMSDIRKRVAEKGYKK